MRDLVEKCSNTPSPSSAPSGRASGSGEESTQTTRSSRGPHIRPDGRRRARIGRLERSRSGRRTSSGVWSFPPVFPFLRLSGRWLAEAGFPIGQEIAIETGDGRLVIEAVTS